MLRENPLLHPLRAQTEQVEPQTMHALNQMGAYLRTLKAYQVTAEVTTKDVLEDGLKVQFSHRANILTRVPDRLLAEVGGDKGEAADFA